MNATLQSTPCNFRAAVAVEPSRTEIRTFERPAIAPSTGLLRGAITGVCGSDGPYYKRHPQSRGSLIRVHETVGHIDEAGELVSARWGLKESNYVVPEEYVPCGHCEYCLSNEFRLCNAMAWRLDAPCYGATGLKAAPSFWGGFSQRQYLQLHTIFHRAPSTVAPKHAALALPLGNGIESADLQGGAGPGQAVVIPGPGQQGLSCVVAAREGGAEKIIVTGLSTGTDRKRLALAKRLDADHTIEVDQADVLEHVADLPGGSMADLVIDCASGVPATVVSAIQLARRRGTVLLDEQKRVPISEFSCDIISARFLMVKGMHDHSYQSVELALQLIAANRHCVTQMSTHTFGLEDTDLALHTLHGEGVGGAIHMTIDPWK